MLVRAYGGDYADLQNHIADFRALINLFAQRLGAFYVPAVMPIIQRHLWLGLNIFKDHDLARSKLFIFRPEIYYVFNNAAGSLDGVKLPLSMKFTDYRDAVNRIINALVSSEDIGIMSGDILKAYGASNMVQLPMIDENFAIEPIFSQEVLSQINGASLLGPIVDIADFKISQDASGHIFFGR